MSQILEKVTERVQQVVSAQALELYVSLPKKPKNSEKNTVVVRAGERISGLVRLVKNTDLGKHGMTQHYKIESLRTFHIAKRSRAVGLL